MTQEQCELLIRQGDLEEALAALGRGDLGPSAVMRTLWPETVEEPPAMSTPWSPAVSSARA